MTNTIQDPDQAFIDLANSGNIQGLQALYEKYFPAIYRFCYWQTNSSADAEDLTQEVFIAVTKSLPQFRGDALFKNWLYQIAKYKVAYWISQKTQRRELPLLEQLADTPEWVDPENDQYKQQLVKRLLSTLKPEAKQVMTYRYLRNYSVAETAKKLKISESKVKVITHRALKKLQDQDLQKL